MWTRQALVHCSSHTDRCTWGRVSVSVWVQCRGQGGVGQGLHWEGLNSGLMHG